MNRYVLSSAVITTPGHYSYQLISIDEAREWLRAGTFDSTIGYAETAQALTLLIGITIPVNRRQVFMQDGDEALIFRLTCRLGDTTLKGKMTLEYILSNSEIGLLKKG